MLIVIICPSNLGQLSLEVDGDYLLKKKTQFKRPILSTTCGKYTKPLTDKVEELNDLLNI